MRLTLPDQAHSLITDYGLPVEVISLPEAHALPNDELVVTGIAQRDGETLFVKNAKPDRAWEFPSGTIEDGEALDDAITREFTEETGYEVEDVSPVVVVIWAFPNSIITQVVYLIDAGDQLHDPVDEIEAVEWKTEVPDVVSFGNAGRDAFQELLQHSAGPADEPVRDQLIAVLGENLSDTPSPSRRSLAAGAATGGVLFALARKHFPRSESDE